MRVVIMGTGPFALPACRGIVAEGHAIPLVVTRPAAQTLAKKSPPRPVFEWATQAGLPIFEPASINTNEAIARLAELQADLFFVCDYGQILSRDCLSAARLGGINLHGSLLPRHRGAAPVQWALLSGDQQAGVTVIHMTPKLDAGPALAIAQTDILPDETAAALEPRLAELGVEATITAIRALDNWDGLSPLGQLQPGELVTKAPRLKKEDGQLDFAKSAEELERQVRGCQPWPGSFADLQLSPDKQLRILVRSARSIPRRVAALHGAEPGAVCIVNGTEAASAFPADRDWSGPWKTLLGVATGSGTLLISRLQPAGKREMTVEEFVRGHPQLEQAVFTSP